MKNNLPKLTQIVPTRADLIDLIQSKLSEAPHGTPRYSVLYDALSQLQYEPQRTLVVVNGSVVYAAERLA